jgi:hypothetical protein
MGKFARLLAFVVAAAFVAATLVPVAGATAMAVAMSLADSGDGGPCEGCADEDDNLPACDQACVSFLPALPAGAASVVAPAVEAFKAAADEFKAGATGPPEPSPPKPFLLS